MAIRRKIGTKYYLVRERDTPKGKKGTIIGRWSSGGSKTATKTRASTAKKKPTRSSARTAKKSTRISAKRTIKKTTRLGAKSVKRTASTRKKVGRSKTTTRLRRK